MPEPKVAKIKKPPQIFSVITNALDGPFKAQDEILVSVSGQEGMNAYFNIGNERKAIQLTESRQGEYLGKYVVKEGDNFSNQIITAFLFNPKEKTESSYIVPHAITVDTIPPKPVSDLKISSTGDGLILSWKPSADEDLKDFVVMRGDIDNPNYAEIGATSIPEFYDKNIAFGKKYFYRVSARDRAKNVSKFTEKTITAVRKGPTVLPKEIRQNTTLFSSGSPYIIEGEINILKDVIVEIEEGVVLEFRSESRLVSMGKIVAKGSRDARIAFKGENYEVIIKDAGEGAFYLDYGIMEGGSFFSVSNSSVTFSNTEVSRFNTFIKSDRQSVINLNKVNVFQVPIGFNISNSTLSGKEIKVDRANLALNLSSNVSVNAEKIILSNCRNYINADGNVNINEIEVLESGEQDFLKKVKGNLNIKLVVPFGKSFSDIKSSVANDLKRDLAEALLKGRMIEAYDSLKLLEELSRDDYDNLADLAVYLASQLKKTEEALNIYQNKNLKTKDYLSKTISLGKEIKSSPYIVTFVDVKQSLINEKQDIEKISLTKGQWRAVKIYVESLIPDLGRDQLAIINDKILPRFSSYVPAILPIYTGTSNIMFESVYMVYLDRDKLQADLKDAGFLGSKEKDIKIALVDCTGIGLTKRLLTKRLLPLNYPVDDFGIGKCDASNYYEQLKDKQLDVLILIQENVKVSQSLVGGNLKTFNGVVELTGFDPYYKKPLFSLSKGATIYHMNQEDGKELSLKNSFDQIVGILERELISLEKSFMNDETRKGLKKMHYAERYLPPLEIKIKETNPIFANNYKMYEKNAFLKISITNNTSREFEKLKITVMMKEYMDFPTEKVIERLAPLETKIVDIEGIFNINLLNLTENSTIQADIKAKYFRAGEEKEIQVTHPVTVYEKHALTWDDKEKIAIFITVRDPVILDLSRAIVKRTKQKIINTNITTGMAVFDAIRSIGLSYQRDPVSPYNIFSEKTNEIDYIQFGRDTLKRKTGDCDDLVVLFSSLMESLGIETAAVDYPGHILVMFNTGIELNDFVKSGLNENNTIIYDNAIWIPVEMTLLTESFYKAWHKGWRNIKENEGNNLRYVRIRKAWERYKPPTLLEVRLAIDIPQSFENFIISSLTEIAKDRNEYILKLVSQNLVEPETVLYYLYKEDALDDALALSSYLLEKNIISSSFLNDTANLHFIKKNYKEALRLYKKASELDEKNPFIILNILKLLKVTKNEGEYKTYRSKIEKIFPFLKDH